jgi:predicted ATPase
VGRAAEWETLVRTYDGIRDDGRIVVLEGEAGIGKTRLAEELATHARQHRAAVLSARCYDGESNLAYAPVVGALRAALADPACASRFSAVPDRWLSEAARLLPELAERRPGLPSPPPLDSPGAQSNFYDGVRQVMLAACRGDGPGILFLDDLQWADSASLDLLTYIARRLRGEPLCLLLTVRSPDASAQPQIQRMLAEAQRAAMVTVIRLLRLGEGAIRELVAASVTAPVPPGTERRLYQETEGLPFFIVAYLSALTDGVLSVEQPNWSVPGGIQDLLRSRLSRVSGVSAQVLTAAAVIGRSFDMETVCGVSGRGDEETVTALEDLAAQGLIHELREPMGTLPTYDFGHDKVRSLVYDDTSVARRGLLHRRTAEALVATQRRRHDGDSLLGQIAQHYLLAGDKAAAAEFYRQAGERARQLYANTEALSHLRMALALGSADTAALREAIGDVCTILGDYAEALTTYSTAIEGVKDTPEATARLERKRGGVHARRGELDQAQRHFEAALELLDPRAASGERAHIYADLSLVAHRQGRLDVAHELAEQARAFASEADDPRVLAQAYNMLGVLASSQGDVDEAIRQLARSLALAGAADDPDARAAALNNLALAFAARGDAETALTHAQAALALCSARGDRHHEAALHSTMADLLHTLGRPDDTMAHLKAAVSIYAEIGVEAGAVRPEIWKLTEW